MGKDDSDRSPGGEWTTVSVHRETFKQAKSKKQAGESWNSLIQKLIQGYDPEDVTQE